MASLPANSSFFGFSLSKFASRPLLDSSFFPFIHYAHLYIPFYSQWPAFSYTCTACTTLIVASFILISLTMIPKRFWQGASATPDSSAASSIRHEFEREKNASHRSVSQNRRRTAIIFAIILILLGLVLGLSLGLTVGRQHDDHANNSTQLPVVDLGYSRYQGNNFQHGVSQWLGMRYAEAPLGELRFAAPQDPPYNNTLQSASKVGRSKLKYSSVSDGSSSMVRPV